jgi:hypothetical protein
MIDFGKLVMAGQAAPMGIWLRDGDSERPTMLAELFAAADEWRQSAKRLDLGRALAQVDPSLVDPQTGLTRGNVFGLYREVLGIRHHRPVETAFGDARCGRPSEHARSRTVVRLRHRLPAGRDARNRIRPNWTLRRR